jgi:hypothetical protein
MAAKPFYTTSLLLWDLSTYQRAAGRCTPQATNAIHKPKQSNDVAWQTFARPATRIFAIGTSSRYLPRYENAMYL